MEEASGATIRMATPGDVEELTRLRWEFSGEHHAAAMPEPDFRDAMASMLDDALGSNRWRIWVAEDPRQAGVLVGMAFLQLVTKVPRPYPRASAWGYVTSVYVAPAWRNGGLGARMLASLVDDARALGLDTLLLWPSERAVPLYRRLGFRTPGTALELTLDP